MGANMGIFPNYNKEGPGVYADDPKHGPFVRFFQTYSSKFFKLVTTNLMFVIFNIPAMLIAYAGTVFFLPQLNPVFDPAAFQQYLSDMGIAVSDGSAAGGNAALQLYFLLVLFMVMFTVGMQLVAVGPVQTGLSYVYRNYARETTTFLWSDFASAVKKDWKPSAIASLVSVIGTVVILFNIVFYTNVYQGQYSQIFSAIFIVIFVIFMCVQIFVYPMIASVDLKLRYVYRNAILFFLGRLIPTIGIFLVNLIVLFVIPVIMLFSFTYAGFALSIFYYLFFAFSFVQYLNTFFVWQQIERYIAKPVEEVTSEVEVKSMEKPMNKGSKGPEAK